MPQKRLNFIYFASFRHILTAFEALDHIHFDYITLFRILQGVLPFFYLSFSFFPMQLSQNAKFIDLSTFYPSKTSI